jgi:hypothetical protein
MSTEQLGLLGDWEAELDQAAELEHVRRHREAWRYCWPEWGGPRVGELVEVAECIAKQEDGTPLYAYMESCRLLEERPDGSWLAVIEMGEVHGEPWLKDGTRLLLAVTDIWPPTRQLWEARRGG